MEHRSRPWLTLVGFVVLAGAAQVAAVPTAHAFDARRRGFSLEFGAGLGSAPAEKFFLDGDHADVAFRSRSAIATRSRLGWGVTDRVAIQWVNDVGWTKGDYNGHVDALYLSSASGLGATYFLRRSAPSLLVEAGGGGSTNLALQTSYDRDRASGAAWWGGIGYEFSTGWLVRGTVSWSSAAADYVSPLGVSDANQPVAVLVSVDRFWY